MLTNRLPKDILSVSTDFLETIGLQEHLSITRKNGLASMIKSIESAALSFKPVYMKVSNLASAFRDGALPLVGYIFKNRFYIDLKAVLPHQVDRLTDAIDQV